MLILYSIRLVFQSFDTGVGLSSRGIGEAEVLLFDLPPRF